MWRSGGSLRIFWTEQLLGSLKHRRATRRYRVCILDDESRRHRTKLIGYRQYVICGFSDGLYQGL